jgi:hypothetical protein
MVMSVAPGFLRVRRRIRRSSFLPVSVSGRALHNNCLERRSYKALISDLHGQDQRFATGGRGWQLAPLETR